MSAPSIFRKAIRLGQACIEHLLAGMPLTTDGIYNKRLESCKSCEHFENETTCNLCGCNMLEKARWADQSCAIEDEDKKKWLAHKTYKIKKPRTCCD